VVPSNDTDTPFPENFENIDWVLVADAGVVGADVVGVVDGVVAVVVDDVVVGVGASGLAVVAALPHATTVAATTTTAAAKG
jgi:hypothetical protein